MEYLQFLFLIIEVLVTVPIVRTTVVFLVAVFAVNFVICLFREDLD